MPARLPIRTVVFNGLPITVWLKALPSAICTSSTLFSGTNIRRMPVQRCPAFSVISFLISFIKISHSGILGFTSLPNTIQFKLSASIVKGVFSFIINGLLFSINPVVALPVKVTTSWLCTWLSISPALPQINCNAPSGKIFEAIISFTTASVK